MKEGSGEQSFIEERSREFLPRPPVPATQEWGVAGRNFKDVGANFKRALHRSIDEQPMATVAFAAIAGFVLGTLWKS